MGKSTVWRTEHDRGYQQALLRPRNAQKATTQFLFFKHGKYRAVLGLISLLDSDAEYRVRT